MEKRFKDVQIDTMQEMDIDKIKAGISYAAETVETYCPNSRGSALAMTKLEEALFWATKSICGND